MWIVLSQGLFSREVPSTFIQRWIYKEKALELQDQVTHNGTQVLKLSFPSHLLEFFQWTCKSTVSNLFKLETVNTLVFRIHHWEFPVGGQQAEGSPEPPAGLFSDCMISHGHSVKLRISYGSDAVVLLLQLCPALALAVSLNLVRAWFQWSRRKG